MKRLQAASLFVVHNLICIISYKLNNCRIYVNIVHFRTFLLARKMNYTTDEKVLKVSVKPPLAFSIDKIMGHKKEVAENKEQVKPNNDYDASSKLIESNFELRDSTDLIDREKSSFKPVKRSLMVGEEEYAKHQDYLAAQYQHAAAVIKNELHKRQIMPYMGRDICDVNMNSVSLIHPAFMLGRLTPDEYRAQILQNISVFQNQWPNLNKDNSQILDSYKWTNMKCYATDHIEGGNKSPEHAKIDKIQAGSRRQQESMTECSPSRSEHRLVERSNSGASSDEDLSKTKDKDIAKDSDCATTATTTTNKRVIPKSQKSFSCPECGKLFNAHYNLTRHMPVHTGMYFACVYLFRCVNGHTDLLDLEIKCHDIKDILLYIN